MRGALVVARDMQLPFQREDQRHGMLRHRRCIDAACARQADAGTSEVLARVLVGAGADRLDEGEPRRLRDQLVAPQHRDAEHVGFANARGKLVGRLRTSKCPMPVRRSANRSAMR